MNRAYKNKDFIKNSEIVGCYYCCKIYKSSELNDVEWHDSGMTPECAKCSVDAVVPYDEDLDGSIENFKNFLNTLHRKSF